MALKKIELITDNRNRQEDVDKLDHFRDGYATDLDSPKTAGVLFDLIETVNELVDMVEIQLGINEGLQNQILQLQKKKGGAKQRSANQK